MKNKYDFGGWATKYDLSCSDGRTILKGAFAHCDEKKVPLVWNHTYDSPENIIGHATLVHKDEGVYAYCEFNETPAAETAKNLVKHRDITSLSIYANKLKQSGNKVLHGDIKEVSLVLAGANPGASIQEVLIHGEDVDASEATIYNDSEELEMWHADEPEGGEDIQHADDNETVADIYNSMSEKQKMAVAAIIDQLADSEDEDNEGEENQNGGETDMKHNVFDKNNNENEELKHSINFADTLKDAKRCGSFKEAFLVHAKNYGIKDIESLFPDAKDIYENPQFIKRDTSWVGPFMAAIHKSPFSKLKAMYADITADEARARGYIKGKLKKEEVFSLLKRTTEPTTIYKKQKLDRDDVIDITSFDVIAWIKAEMRMMLEEEIARAILVGDGRSAMEDDKIKESCIRPIYNDSDLFTIKYAMGADPDKAMAFIKACIKSRVDYEGSMPSLYTTEEMIADMLLLQDTTGRFIYESEAALAKTLRVKEIVPVPFIKGLVRDAGDSQTHNVYGIIVNPSDYTVGADKGGQVSMFDDFDIDYNQQKYLIETRCSGSLMKPKTAIVIEEVK